MYCEYYGFAEEPFDITPDPSFLYLSPGHEEILTSIVYGIQGRRGLMAVIGEVGTGKTTILNTALEWLSKKTRVAYVINFDVSFEDQKGAGVSSNLDELAFRNRFKKMLSSYTERKRAMRKNTWEMAGGRVIDMCDMETSHILNCIGLLSRNLVAMRKVDKTGAAQKQIERKIAEFNKELKKRY